MQPFGLVVIQECNVKESEKHCPPPSQGAHQGNSLDRVVGMVRRVSSVVDTGAQGLLVILCLSMALVVMLQVFSRYVLNHSLFWSEELGRMLLVWLTFVGATVAYKRGAHPGVRVLVQRLPRRLEQSCRLVAHAACILLFVVMLIHGWRFWNMLAPQMTVSLGLSRQVPFSAIPLAGAVLLLHGAAFFLETVAELRR